MMQTGGGCAEISSRAALELLRSLRDVHILIHRSPDGDCVGGGYALYHILKEMGIRARVCCADPIPAVFDEITKEIAFADFVPQAYISVDVADYKLLGALEAAEQKQEILLCIDHHISNTHYAKHLHWNPDASAACEVLYWLMKESGIPLTREIAFCLYIGIATDTGCFQYSNASASAFDAVADIKRNFPDLPYARINRELFVLKSKGRIAIDSRLMRSVQLSEDGKIALIYLPHAWMEELAVSSDEVDSVANLPMQIIGVEIGITCKQQKDGSYRISLRGGDRADVAAVAQHFGGGGHVKASGCTVFDGEPEDVCRMLMDVSKAMLKGQLQ